MGSMDSTTDTTAEFSTVVLGTPDTPSLFDDNGQCRYQWDGSKPRPLITARWPSDPKLREARRAAILARFDALVARVLYLQQWQATTALRNMRDRSNDLQAAQDRITALRAIYIGP